MERRYFNTDERVAALERQGYTCPVCGQAVDLKNGDGHHMAQCWQGGATHVDNIIMVHRGKCHEYLDARATLYGNVFTLGHLSLAEDTQIVDKAKQASACMKINDLNSTLERREANQSRMSKIMAKFK